MIATVLSKGSHQSFPWSDSPNRFLSQTCCRMRSNTPVTERSRSARRVQIPNALYDIVFGKPGAALPKMERERYSINWKRKLKKQGGSVLFWRLLSRGSERTQAK